MTREEAIDRLKEARAGHKEFLSIETLNMAIKALQQKSCEDAISRQDILNILPTFRFNGINDYLDAKNKIEKMSAVHEENIRQKAR